MYKVGFIGTGGRSVVYADAYQASKDIEIVSLADPNEEHRRALVARSGLRDDIPEFDNWRDMLNAINDLDGVVICTPNHLHADQVVECLERGVPIALEKPLATTMEDCERILDAKQANGGRVLLGLVLRSTPFYSKIHELISSSAIGQVVSIQADELVGVGVTSLLYRSQWRRHSETSGGSMLEKSCHDMDILNWMMESQPVALSSHGSSPVFAPDPTVPDVCDNCPRTSTCQYYKQPVFSSHEDVSEVLLHQFVQEDNRCIYNIDKDNVDVQSVSVEYESGAIANFLLNFNSMGPRAGRNFHAVGTGGMVWGNLRDKTVYFHENLSGETRSYDSTGDGSGHGGGDRLHVLLLGRMIRDPDYMPDQGVEAGYLSAVMCFASDISRTERRVVGFEYESGGRVTFS